MWHDCSHFNHVSLVRLGFLGDFCSTRSNHFQQSYSLQVQWIMEAVFARLGVRHQARNFGNGGMGTLHNGLGASSIYGPDVDFLMWDSSMTEKESEAGDRPFWGDIKFPFCGP